MTRQKQSGIARDGVLKNKKNKRVSVQENEKRKTRISQPSASPKVGGGWCVGAGNPGI